jgi:N-acetylglucosamine-6-phosphate deacetylase
MLIYNARIFTPTSVWQPGWLLAEGKMIAAMGPGNPPEFEPGRVTRSIDAGGGLLLPGFIDLHVHGAMGREVMDGDPDGLREMARFYARHGVTAFLATTWTASREGILRALEAVHEVVGLVRGGATILGVHLEGPYLNPKKTGAQDVRLIRRADRVEALEFLDSGLVRLLALAPEFPENLWLIDECVRRGITDSAAHTEAGLDELSAAVTRGLRHVTHCYNAMRPAIAISAPGRPRSAAHAEPSPTTSTSTLRHEDPGRRQTAFQGDPGHRRHPVLACPEGDYSIDEDHHHPRWRRACRTALAAASSP